MDHSDRTAALKLAKALIRSHGLAAHMNKYNQDQLAREVIDDVSGFNYDFHLDPKVSGWSDQNPSCNIQVNYVMDPKGSRIAEDGSMVVDSIFTLRIGTNSSAMALETFRKREAMVSMATMLCEMLTVSLPPRVTSLMETAEEVADRTQRALEQAISTQIVDNVGHAVLKGLRTNGTPRSVKMTSTYSSADGKYPAVGTYRYRHVRHVDSKGRAKVVTLYKIQVFKNYFDDACPPSIAIKRVDKL